MRSVGRLGFVGRSTRLMLMSFSASVCLCMGGYVKVVCDKVLIGT